MNNVTEHDFLESRGNNTSDECQAWRSLQVKLGESLEHNSEKNYEVAEPMQVGIGTAVFLVVLPFVLFHWRRVPIGAPTAVLGGAVLMVLCGVLTQDEAYAILGERSHVQTICLLLGTMLLARFFEREKLLSSGLKFLLPQCISTPALLARVSLISFFTAALFTNDAACVMLTPAVLIHWVNHKRDADELPVLLLAIATSANIGSSATVFGNPQMALIAAKTDSPLFAESRLDLRTCVLYLGLPALLCGLCNVVGLSVYYIILNKLHRNVPQHEEGVTSTFTISNGHQIDLNESSGSRTFQIMLMLVLCAVVALLFASTPAVKFDIGLIPVAGGTLLLILDAILNKGDANATLRQVDWSILIMFFGIFVWLKGFNTTKLPHYFWNQLGLVKREFNDALSMSLLYVFVVIGSNLFSNVPLTILVLDQIPPCEANLPLVLYLAWLATIAGNLTLFGSVANLIVVQKAHDTLAYRLSFWQYLAYGFASTIILSLLGMALIFVLLTFTSIN